MKYEVIIVNGLPEGVELDPFGLKGSNYAVNSNGRLTVTYTFVANMGQIRVAPKEGYRLSGGHYGDYVIVSKLPVEKEFVVIKFEKPENFIYATSLAFDNGNANRGVLGCSGFTQEIVKESV